MIESYNKSDQLFKMAPTENGQSEVLFRAFDDPQKMRGVQPVSIGIIEATNVSEEHFQMARMRIRGAERGFIYGDTNPSNFEHWFYKMLIDKESKSFIPGAEVVFSHTLDNAPNLPEDYINDMLSLKDTNKHLYERMVEGRWPFVSVRLPTAASW